MLTYPADQNGTRLSIYYGWRLGDKTTADDVVVRVIPDTIYNDEPIDLPLYLDKVNHSPTGFAWGYGGSGPSQLAFAILAFEIGPDDAKSLYQDFKRDFVAGWGSAWSITSVEIEEWLIGKRAELAGTDSGKHFG